METPKIGRIVLIPCQESERDGVIWYWRVNPSRIGGLPVRLLKGKPLQPKQPLWDENFLDTADLLDAINQRDQSEVERLIHEQLDDLGRKQKTDLPVGLDTRQSEEAIKNPISYAAANLSSGLDGARFVVWWRDREKCLDVGIYCPQPRAAAYSHLLAHAADPFPVGRCKECKKRLLRNRWHPSTYCSHKCRNTRNVRESRKRKRQQRRRARK